MSDYQTKLSASSTSPLALTTRYYAGWAIVILAVVGGSLLLSSQTDWFSRLFFLFGEETPWFLTRSSGMVAYILMTFSMIWGLVLSTQSIRGQVPPPIALAAHNVLSWLSLLLAVIHAVVLRASTFFEYAWLDIFVPFRGPYRPFWVGLGVVALYLMFVVNISFDWRKWLGQKTWRWLHYTTFLVYFLVTIHVIQSGSDVDRIGMQVIIVASIAIFLFLTLFRLLLGQRVRSRRKQ